MVNKFFNKEWVHGFDLDKWLRGHRPSTKFDVDFWDEIVIEHEEVVAEFRELLNCREQITDKDGNVLSPLDLFNLINEYQMRIEKLTLIFKLRLYKTLNENKRTGIKYIVMRSFWIDEHGKKVKWFSRNLGSEAKVLVNGEIPVHQMKAIEKDMLQLMWDQYVIEYWDNVLHGFDADWNNIRV